VCVWTKTAEKKECSLREYGQAGSALSLPGASVTALAFAPFTAEESRIIAIGLETGVIMLYGYHINGWNNLYEMDTR
jgi:hypothetical protein